MIGHIMVRTGQPQRLLTAASGDLERLPHPVLAHRRDLASGETIAAHRHRRAQLVHASAGVMTVTTEQGAFVVPPERGVWMPAGVEHVIHARTPVAMRTLYVDPRRAPGLPDEVRVVTVSPLLRELILAAVATWPVSATKGIESMFAVAKAVTRLVAPGPLVAMHTPTRPLARAYPSAI